MQKYTGNKYELTDETIDVNNHILHRIKALKDFGNVKKGDKGGYIEKEFNLSQKGNCWIYCEAWVYDDAKVLGNAKVYDDAQVYGNAGVYENAVVSHFAKVYDNAWVFGRANIYGNAKVFGNSSVYGPANVYGNAEVFGNARIYTDYFV